MVWAVPDYRARAAGAVIPNDRGTGPAPGDWRLLQWNFAGPFGVNAPEAWGNVAAAGTPGGRGVIVAVLDTGVAYANHGPFRRSPDLSRFRFVGDLFTCRLTGGALVREMNSDAPPAEPEPRHAAVLPSRRPSPHAPRPVAP